jgi:uncharacterized protein YjbI with pentapeptide repeats
MKASEVLRRYAAGERDFRHADLRGQSFQGQDLSGADFSEADIRGANFTNAILKETNFTNAKAGVQKRWMIAQFIAASWFSGVLSIASMVINQTFVERVVISQQVQPYMLIPAILLLPINAKIVLTIASQGFTAKVAGRICLIGLLAGFATLVASSATVKFAIIVTLLSGLIFSVVVTPMGVLILLFAAVLGIIFSSAGAIVLNAFVFISVRALMGEAAFDAAFKFTTIDGVVFGAAVPVAFLGLYIESCVLQESEEFAVVGRLVLAFTTMSSTAFCGADLTGSDFTKATLTSADFSYRERSFFNDCLEEQLFFDWDKYSRISVKPTYLNHVCWKDAKNLELAKIEDSILTDPRVRDLLTTQDGYKKSYVGANLRNANLNGVNLENANLSLADLSGATSRSANLRNTNLLEAAALNTDFTRATLTGACLEGWNIDSKTNLEQVDCQYVYLIRNQQERRPSSGDFAPGEFTKLFQEVLSTVDLIFRNGVDWKAFVAAFKQVQVENEDTPLEIQSIENKGDGVVVVRVSVPAETNKEKIHSEFNQQYEVALKALEARYQAELKAKESEITLYREQSANMWGVINSLANRPINVQAIAKAMNESTDQSQNISVGGDFNLNATNSVVNLRDISGSVTNTINQLPDSADPNRPGIKELLVQLQAVLESADEAALQPDDKADALEQVKVLAEAAQKPEEEKKTLGAKAVRFLRRIVDAVPTALPTASKLVEEVNKLVPAIVTLLGL